VRFVEPLACIGLICAAASPAEAQTMSFNIPAGRLSGALGMLGAQAGITVGANESGLAAIPSRAIRGRLTVRAALTRLLAGTGYGFTFVGPRTVRITRAPRPVPPVPRARAVAPPPSPPLEAPPGPEAEIIVTASKQGVSLARFPGTARVIDFEESDIGRFGESGTEAALARLPMLGSTSLGPGRNKIFIRGIADSSFNGQSQSVVGQYLGEARLTFNAPDPDLRLYDIGRVEVLEGPQGTLYGTGSLGGIIRLIPNAPDPSGIAASVTAGLTATQHGNPGGDLSAMINLPLVTDRLTLRAVGYGSIEGGYIDDVGRGLSDVNRTTIYGGRAALCWEAGDDWQIELGGTIQFIAGRDGQYAERGLPDLTRNATLAQPFENDYSLADLIVRKRWPSVELVSATTVVWHDLETRFDATGAPGTSGPQLYGEDIGITLISNETRLSRPDSEGAGWVVGWSLLHDISSISRSLGPPTAQLPIAGVRNEVTEAALFGQYSLNLTNRLVATAGGRLTYSRSVGRPLDAPDNVEEPRRSDFRLSPSVALSWRAGPGAIVYTRYQQGFRAGGLAISATGSTTVAERFRSDRVMSVEAGIRLGQPETGRLSVNAAISFVRWADIQADLVDSRGLPVTANIGSGQIFGAEVETTWRPFGGLTLEMAAFLNETQRLGACLEAGGCGRIAGTSQSSLTNPAPAFAGAIDRDLPNVAGRGARLAVHYRASVSPGIDLSIASALRYVGPSRLGIGTPLDIAQGDYLDTQVGARLDFGRFGISFDVDNVGDVRGNRFAFGNPFSVGSGTQLTPLRPRTVRIGFDASF
jgi:outer membrane receptor protein involved in Fe transport